MIKIDENYRIETDAHNFILKYEKPTGELHAVTGKEKVSRAEWYYPKIEYALEKYKSESLKEPESIKEVWLKLDEVDKTIRNISRKLEKAI